MFRRVVILGSLLVLTACGGGGGGSSVAMPPTTPTAPTTPTIYTSNCSTALNALSCQDKAMLMTAFARLTPDINGTFQYAAAPSYGGEVYLSFDHKGTTSTADDTFVVTQTFASTSTTTYGPLTTGNDGLGVVRTGTGTSNFGSTSQLDLFEMANVLGGGLDYIQIARISKINSAGLTGPAGSPNAFYLLAGQVNTASNLPTTGTAQYAGSTRGSYVRGPTDVLSTQSDLAMTVNFGSHSLSGSASNFTAVDSTGAAASLTDNLNFTFSGTISTTSYATFSGTAAGAIMQGTIQGGFYGNTTAGQEAGLVYALSKPGVAPGNGPTMIGAGGMKRTN